jgi:excisionase family DNA binding protein
VIYIRALTIKEVAEHLGVSERTAYHYAKTEKSLKAVKIGRHIRVMSHDLEAWIKKQQLH